MNILIDILPETVEIDGEEYSINIDFRISILYELLMQDINLTDDEKLVTALKLYYPEIPPNISEAVEKMLWFYRCGKNIEGNTEDSSEKEPSSKPQQIYSYEHDADYIYAAYLSQYRLDLQDIDQLHWWKFKALFQSLKEDNELVKIMNFRSMKIDSDMSKSEKKYYRKMKKLYALPDNRTVEEKEEDFHGGLAGMF